jgi:hypothetical protein
MGPIPFRLSPGGYGVTWEEQEACWKVGLLIRTAAYRGDQYPYGDPDTFPPLSSSCI